MPRTLYENRLVVDQDGPLSMTSTGEYEYNASHGESLEVAEDAGTTYGLLRVFTTSAKGDLTLYDDKIDFLGLPWRFAASSGISLLATLLVVVLIRRLYRKLQASNERALIENYANTRKEQSYKASPPPPVR